MAEVLVGVDLGGTNTKIGLFDNDLALLSKVSIPTQIHSGPKAVIDRIGKAIEDLLARQGLSLKNVVAAGIGSPGILDFDAGVILASSNLNFTNVPLRQMLSDRLGKPVILENDANITCWAEYTAGAGRGVADMVLVAIGTGVGGGIISNGELVHGLVNNAGELGHVIIYPGGRLCGCGQKGCVEAYGSAGSTAARATEAVKDSRSSSSLAGLLAQKGELTCKDVFEHAAAGDKLAMEIIDGTAESLALLCINILHFTGPRKVIFFGGMIGAGPILLDSIKKYFDRYIWTIKKEEMELCFAHLGDDAGIIGAASLAKHLFSKPPNRTER